MKIINYGKWHEVITIGAGLGAHSWLQCNYHAKPKGMAKGGRWAFRRQF